MPVLFALIPILLFFGIAVQGPTIYLASIAPAIYFWKRGISPEHAAYLRKIGLIFITMWLIFPMINVLHFFLHTHPTAVTPTWGSLLKSNLSSSFLVASIALLALGLFAHKSPRTPASRPLLGGQVVWWLSMGLAAAVVLLAPYFIFQAITGFSYKHISGHLDGREVYGLFRISGFYGNSLWLGSVALELFCFTWFLFWVVFAERTRGESALRNIIRDSNFWWARKVAPWALLTASVGQFAYVLLSGGRTVIALAFCSLVTIPFLVKMSPTGTLVRMWALGTSALVAGVTIISMGFLSRILGTVEAAQSGHQVTSRTHIWKVHWAIFCDFPWLGAGESWLNDGLVRKAYYQQLTPPTEFPNFYKLQAHNLYIQTLVNVGVIGTVAVVALLGWAVWLTFKQTRATLLTRTLFTGVALCFASNFFHGVTENTYYASNILLVALYLFLATIWVTFTEPASGQKN